MRLQGLRAGFGQGWMHVLVTADFCSAFAQVRPIIVAHPCLNSPTLGSHKIMWNICTSLTKGYVATPSLRILSVKPISCILSWKCRSCSCSIHLHRFSSFSTKSRYYRRTVSYTELLHDTHSKGNTWKSQGRVRFLPVLSGLLCAIFKGTMNVQTTVAGNTSGLD